jgi:hypothetical protein
MSKSGKSQKRPRASKPGLILLGLDENGKPRAARFPGSQVAAVKKAAKRLSMVAVPSVIVADALRTTHEAWLAAPGKKGQPHKDSNVRRLLPRYKMLETRYPLGWLDQYHEAWTLLNEVVAQP